MTGETGAIKTAMKISFWSYHYYIEGRSRGPAANDRSIASALRRRGHEVELEFRAQKQESRSAGEAVLRGLKRISWLRRYGHVPKLLLRNIKLGRQERRILGTLQPDVVMALSSYCNISALRAARSRSVPFVLYVHAPLEYEYSVFHSRYKTYSGIGTRIEGIKVRKADQVICVSEILKDYLMRHGAPATKLHVVPNGADLNIFKPAAPEAELLDKFNLRGKVVAGFVGSFSFFTDVKRFVRTLKAVCDKHENVSFLFVGNGEGGRRITEAAEPLGLREKLIFVGPVEHAEVPRYLNAIDIAVCPYRSDYLFYNSPLKLFEYMAAAKPVLSVPLGQIREVIRDGYNGVFYDCDDESSMAGKLSALLSDAELRKRLGANARRTVEEGWTRDHQAARIEKVLELAVEGAK